MKRKSYRLYTAKNTGGTIAECFLAIAKQKIERIDLDYEKDVVGKNSELVKLNPLARVPTLQLPDGEVLTETAAILFYLAEKSALVRAIVKSRDPHFLRTLFIINTEIYPTFTFADDPAEWVRGKAAGKELRESAMAYRKELWRMLEAQIPRGKKSFLKSGFSAIDVYLSVMTSWTPGEQWFREETPKIWVVRESVAARPELKEIFARNFS